MSVLINLRGQQIEDCLDDGLKTGGLKQMRSRVRAKQPSWPDDRPAPMPGMRAHACGARAHARKHRPSLEISGRNPKDEGLRVSSRLKSTPYLDMPSEAGL